MCIIGAQSSPRLYAQVSSHRIYTTRLRLLVLSACTDEHPLYRTTAIVACLPIFRFANTTLRRLNFATHRWKLMNCPMNQLTSFDTTITNMLHRSIALSTCTPAPRDRRTSRHHLVHWPRPRDPRPRCLGRRHARRADRQERWHSQGQALLRMWQ
jgi:hypothetical protein